MLAQTQRLIDIMARLRDPETGCPWDLKQDYKSLATYTLEEAYEVVDAVEHNDMAKLKDELGDLLLQIVFYAQMAGESGLFDFEDVAETISDKMARRHPHIFGDATAETAEDVSNNWEAIKAAERKQAGEDDSHLSGIAHALPALSRAEKLSKRAVRIGFEWPDFSSLMDKVEEELLELRAEIDKDSDQKEEELGDLLFTIVNVARWQKIDPEMALKQANLKFERRFRSMERQARQSNRLLEDFDLDQMEEFWDAAKRQEREDSLSA